MRLYAYLAALVLLIASHFGAYCHGVSVTRDQWRLDNLAADVRQQATERARETAWRNLIDEEVQRAELTRKDIEADRDAAQRIAVGLRGQLDKYARRACAAPAPTTSGQAEPAACGVLPDMLVSLEARGRAVAEEADRARAAGLICERIADGLTAAAPGAAASASH